MVVDLLPAQEFGEEALEGRRFRADLTDARLTGARLDRADLTGANLTRADGEEFLGLAPHLPVRTSVETFPLEEANEALDRLRRGELQGSAVLVVHALP